MINIDLICFGCMKRLEHPWTVCPHCGHDNTIRENDAGYLPAMLLQGQYFVGRALGRGGFGITYLGLDLSLDRVVAIKEYFPASLSTRMPDSRTLHAYNANLAEYEHGCEKAVEEGRIGARVGRLPNVVQIYNVFQANNTAYIVMEYIQGKTLAGYMKDHGGKLSWAELQRLMFPVMQSLARLHEMQIIHRDVSPDNIMIRYPEDEAVLLDFGAAHTVSDKTMSEHSISLRLGFAPLEQYSRLGKQDGRIDEYAMCATLYYALTGQRPPDATERMYAGTEMTRPRQMGADIPAHAENALMKGLALRADERYPDMAALLSAFQGKTRTNRSAAKAQKKKKGNAAVIVAASVAVLGAAAGGVMLLNNAPQTPDPAAVTGGQSTAAVTNTPDVTNTPGVTNTPDVSAENVRIKEAGFEALTQRGGTCTIIGYSGGAKSAALPETIQGVPVTGIAALQQSGLQELTIHGAVAEIQEGALDGNVGMTVHVDESNPYFYVEDDMIIRREDMCLMWAKEREHLIIPEGIRKIEAGALPDPQLHNDTQLEKMSVTLPASMEPTCGPAFNHSHVNKITVAEGNPDLRVEDGVLIYRNKVVACPPMLEQSLVTLPDNVTEIEDLVFRRSQVKQVVLGPNVVKIGDGAFEYAQTESISIPASVTEIGQEAFWDCPNLTLRVEAGSYAEQYAISNRISYELIESQSPEGYTFTTRNRQDGTCILTGVEYEGTIMSLEVPYAIDGHTVTDIECRFDDLHGLRSITLPAGVKNIQCDTFDYCNHLETIMVDEANPYYQVTDNMLIRLEDMALVWASVSGRTMLNIPEGVKQIDVHGLSVNVEAKALDGMEILPMEVVFPSTLTNVPVPPFFYTNVSRVWLAEGNTSFWLGDNQLLMKDTTAIACPPMLEQDTVIVPDGTTYIDNYCFANSRVKHVMIPASVTSFGVDVFLGYEGQVGVAEGSYAEAYMIKRGIPYSIWGNVPAVSDISDYDADASHFEAGESDGGVAITGYTGSSAKLAIPAEINGTPVVAIADGAFTEQDITHVVIPEGVKVIDNHAFQYCRNLSSVTLPESLESIGIQSFTGCAVENVYLGANVQDIHVLSFEGCEKLTEINLSVDNKTFTLVEGCLVRREDMALVCMPFKGTDEVVIPEGIRIVKGEQHRVSNQVNKLVLPSTLEQVDGLAIRMLTNGVSAIWIAEGNQHLYWDESISVLMCDDTLAFYFSGEPVIPEGTTRIASGAFLGAAFDTLTIPDSVNCIEELAFRHYKGSRIIVPASVTTIEDYAFEDCQNLTLVVESGSAAEAYAIAFEIPYEVQAASAATPSGDVKTGTAAGFSGEVTVHLTTDYLGSINWIEADVSNEIEPIGGQVAKSEAFMAQFIGKTGPINQTDIDVVSGATITSNAVIAAANDALDSSENAAPVATNEADFKVEADGDGVTITGYAGSDSELVIPATIGGKAVTVIGESAFEDNKTITKVYISDGITEVGYHAFAGCEQLAEVRLPETLVTIRDWSFGNCYALKEISIPASVSCIEDLMFANSNELNSIQVAEDSPYFAMMDGLLVEKATMKLLWTPINTVQDVLTIPEGIRKLGKWTVRNANSIVLPSTLEEIDDNAFIVSGQVRSIRVAENNQHFSVKDGMLMRGNTVIFCPQKMERKDITLPAGTERVEAYAFFGIDGKNITVPGSVKEIGFQAFSCCRGGSVVLEEGVELLDLHAFSDMENMTVTLPESVTVIKYNAFADQKENVTIRVVEGSYAQVYLKECGIAYEVVEPATPASPETDFTVKENNTGLTITRYTGSDADVVIPSVIKGRKVTQIGGGAFQENMNIQSVVIPEGVWAIGRTAFYRCQSLTQVQLPSTLERIGEYAFVDCNLQTLELPDGMTAIGDCAFGWNGQLTTVKLPASLTEIGKNAFDSCEMLTSAELPSGLTTIGACAFSGCDLQEISIPDGVTTIGEYAFQWNPNAASVNIPKSVTEIGAGAFSSLEKIKTIQLDEENTSFAILDGMLVNTRTMSIVWAQDEIKGPLVISEGIRHIQESALMSNEVESITLPASLESFDIGALSTLFNLEEIKLAAGNQHFKLQQGMLIQGDTLVACPARMEGGSITVPDSVANIAQDTFAYMDGQAITIAGSVKEIGENVFFSASGCQITLQEGVTTIHDYAFDYAVQCTLTLPASISSIGQKAFTRCEDCVFRIYEGSYAQQYMDEQGMAYELLNQKTSDLLMFSDYTAATENGSLAITRYLGPGGTVEVPASIGDMAVTAIASGAFADRPDVRRVSIPAGVEAIAADAFSGCDDVLLIVSHGSGAEAFAKAQGLVVAYRREQKA